MLTWKGGAAICDVLIGLRLSGRRGEHGSQSTFVVFVCLFSWFILFAPACLTCQIFKNLTQSVLIHSMEHKKLVKFLHAKRTNTSVLSMSEERESACIHWSWWIIRCVCLWVCGLSRLRRWRSEKLTNKSQLGEEGLLLLLLVELLVKLLRGMMWE